MAEIVPATITTVGINLDLQCRNDLNTNFTNLKNKDIEIADRITGLATVATTGSYNDLTDKPTTLFNVVSVPASATSTGTPNQIAFDSNYFYICVATNTWVRASLVTW